MSPESFVLGISAHYHDASAALVTQQGILAAAQEERFSRIKHDWRFPAQAIDFCLTKLPSGKTLDAVVFYENPLLKADRMLSRAVGNAPAGSSAWRRMLQSLQVMNEDLPAALKRVHDNPERCFFTTHHRAHAASAFYSSSFDNSAVLVVDGVGEWSTTSIWRGVHDALEPLAEIRYPDSLGLFYSAFTQYCGFRVNSGEYKLMGLAPFGRPIFRDRIKDEIIDIKPDGSFRLNLEYFQFQSGLQTTSPLLEYFLGQPNRMAGASISQHFMDVAASAQAVLEEVMDRLCQSALKMAQSSRLCLAGGVALNCVSNGRFLRNYPETDLWIQPAAGDAGGALGAAQMILREKFSSNSGAKRSSSTMKSAFLGPEFADEAVEAELIRRGLSYSRPESSEALIQEIVNALLEGKVVGHFDGRMEFGPRALGNRSILADPRPTGTMTRVNRKVKFREAWRPFAPLVLAEYAGQIFNAPNVSPYMLLVTDLKHEFRSDETLQSVRNEGVFSLVELQEGVRSDYTAVTHVDYSSRLQTIASDSPSRARLILERFNKISGCPMLLNTSFNVRGEPVVCSPEDAVACFINTEIDVLAIGAFTVHRDEQSRAVRSQQGKVKFNAD